MIEIGPHGTVHNFIGGNMATMTSTDDPLFFVHHGNVDRWLAMWSDMWNHDQLSPSELRENVHYAVPTAREQERIQVQAGQIVTGRVASGIDDCMTFTSNPTGLFTDPANASNCATPRRMVHIGNSPSAPGFEGMYYRYETPDSLVNVINTNYPEFRNNWHWFPLYSVKKRDITETNDVNSNSAENGILSDSDNSEHVIAKRAISAGSPLGNFSCKSSNVLYQLVQADFTTTPAQRLRAVEFRECQLYGQKRFTSREWITAHGLDPDHLDFPYPVPICQSVSSVEALLGVSPGDQQGSNYVAYSTGLIAGLAVLIVILIIIAAVFGILLFQENKKINISSASIL